MHKHTGTRNVLSLKFPPPDDGCDASSSLFSLLSSVFPPIFPGSAVAGCGGPGPAAAAASSEHIPEHDTGGQQRWCWSPGRHRSTGYHFTPTSSPPL